MLCRVRLRPAGHARPLPGVREDVDKSTGRKRSRFARSQDSWLAVQDAQTNDLDAEEASEDQQDRPPKRFVVPRLRTGVLERLGQAGLGHEVPSNTQAVDATGVTGVQPRR